MFVDPGQQRLVDPATCCSLLLPIENPRGMAGLANKQKFSGSCREFDSDPTDPDECQHASAVPTATSCTVLMTDSGLLVPPAYICADMPLAQKKAIAAIMRLAAAPIECNTKHSVTHSASAGGVGLE
jgi:hypothetical protein